MTVEQSFLDEFDKRYNENCDQKATRLKNRNVSFDSPFDPRNPPPASYVNFTDNFAKPPTKRTA